MTNVLTRRYREEKVMIRQSDAATATVVAGKPQKPWGRQSKTSVQGARRNQPGQNLDCELLAS